MARTTTNYGFNISEGTDLVNPLTDIFPNFEDIDTDLKNVSDSSVTTATELKTGTVHALTRSDGDREIIRFTATANFTAGETFTVDGVQVTALTTSGEQLTTGCYIIGSEVLCALKGTLLTFYISQVVTDATTLEGHGASYFATASDLSNTDGNVSALSTKVGTAVLTTTAQDCSGAINELNANLSNIKNLWTNSDPSVSFASQTVILSSADYDVLFVFSREGCNFALKGQQTFYIEDAGKTGTAPLNGTRQFTRTDDTHYLISDCTFNNGNTINTQLIPIAIYGIKL